MAETGPIAEHFDRKACCAPPADEGIPVSSESLLQGLEEVGFRGRSVLDVGCGQGKLIVRMLEAGASSATGVDLSPGTIDVARRRAAAAGLADRVSFFVGDASAERVDAHDIVVLDRVICCFRDLEALLTTTVPAARQAYAFVLPASQGLWGAWSRLWVGAENLWRRVTRDPFRAFVHPVPRIDAQLRDVGFTRTRRERWHSWETLIYAR